MAKDATGQLKERTSKVSLINCSCMELGSNQPSQVMLGNQLFLGLICRQPLQCKIRLGMPQRHTPNQQSNLHSKAPLSKHRLHQAVPQVPTAQLQPAHNIRSSSSSKGPRQHRHPQARRGLRRIHRLKALLATATHPQAATVTSSLAAARKRRMQNLKANLKD